MQADLLARVPRLRPLVTALALAFAVGSIPALAGHRGPSHDAELRARLTAATERNGGDNPRRAAMLERLLERPSGTDIVVTNCDDSGPGSLRDAYFNAPDNATIDLTQLPCSTITLTTGALTNQLSTENLSLQGPGKYALTIDAAHNGRVFVHNGSEMLGIAGMTITNGGHSGVYGGGCIYSYGSVGLIEAIVSQCSMSSSGTAKAYGGAVYAHGDVLLIGSTVKDSTAHAASANSAGGGVWADGVGVYMSTISGNTVSGDGSHYSRGGGVLALGDASIKYSTISDNEAESGGGVFLIGASSELMQVADSTISGNHALGAGGGIYAKYRPFAIYNSTITQNSAGFQIGAGVYLGYATQIQSSIIANNTSQDGLYASDLGGISTVAISGANNLIIASTLTVPADTIAAEPMLGPLQDNGGATMTHALLEGSPAIDHGNNVRSFAVDQRAVDDAESSVLYERVVGPSADIGAFETGAPDRIFTDGFDTEL